MPIDQKRIAKNTLLLYIRMGLIMLISLYTSRVILDALGEVDMGIYSTVAGIVMMFTFLSNTMSTACQRFYAYEMGRDDPEGLNRVFSFCVIVFCALSLLIVVLCETVGLWLLYQKINTDGRMDAALWVFHCAVLSFVFTIIRMPYQGMVIIKEKMKVFAYISIFEALGNLAIAFLIAGTSHDRLILYGILMMLVNVGVSLYYVCYCVRFYPECHFRFVHGKHQFKEIFSFAGWNMIGSLANVCKSQGITILLNMFFGNAVVAARTMAYKVFSTLQQFADNFTTAIKPQIMKSYAAGDKEGMFKLVFQGSKFSFYLLFVLSLPILLETPFLLDFWLKDVPAYTVPFTRLVIVNALIDVFAYPLAVAIQADGRIRNYQLITGGLLLLILPVSYILLKVVPGVPPQLIFWTSIVVCFFALFVRVILVHRCTGMPVGGWLRMVLLPVFIVAIVSSVVPVVLEACMDASVVRFIVVILASILMVLLSSYCLGLTTTERKHIREMVTTYTRRLFSKNQE